MKHLFNFSAGIMLVFSLVACNRMTPAQMAAGADKVVVESEPGILALSCGTVPVKLHVSFPSKYFNPQAVMTVTPVLVYEGGETAAAPIVYQGEKIKENNKTVSVAGTTLTERFKFDYKEAMSKSHLELRAVLSYKGKTIQLPVRKVADGVSSVERFANLGGVCSYKEDGYQTILKKSTEAQINYRVNSAKISKQQLNNESVEDYQDAIADIKKNDRYTITGTQIMSYASPEGGEAYNAKLSDKRSVSAQKAWKTVGKGMKADELEIKSIGQDWEGFKKAVEQSNIPDKDLILRVLAMYSNPAMRESEIKNLSQIYTEIKAEVFPELRRSRFVTNMDYRNNTDAELVDLAEKKIFMLDEPSLLHLANITDDPVKKEFYWNFAFEKFASKKAGLNLAVYSYKAGKPLAAEFYLDRLKDEEDPDVINMRGLVEMYKKNWYKSEDLFEKAATEESLANRGVVNMLQGNYDKAVRILPDGDINKVVSAIIIGDADKAAAALSGNDEKSEYLRAIIAARKGNKSEVLSHLEKSGSYKERAKKDIEFAKYL